MENSGSKNRRNEREWKTEERMRKIENGRNEEHQKEWKTAEINKKMELNRKKEEC